MKREYFSAGILVMAATAGAIVVSTWRGNNDNRGDALRRAIDDGRARNVILFLGDGMGDSEMSTAEMTDATPAVLNSHINERGCQGPANI
jgi:alkaline phosphatase/streptomycin-6-phosphatase